MKINPEMIVLARKMRGMTQIELSSKIGQGQARVSKLEGGIQTDVPDSIVNLICNALDIPVDFLTQNEELLSVGSSAVYYRKKTALSALDRDKINATVNLHRIHLRKLLESVEIESSKPLPKFDIEDYGGSPQKAAQALRAFWSLPDGPIKNVTTSIESAGIIIVPCEFGTKAMDSTAIRNADMPPMIFIRQNMPADRWRFTLAHELAHLVLHDVPHANMEDEADSFASEFLMPEVEISAQFMALSSIRLADLMALKPYWKVSIQAILYRAGELGFLTSMQKTRLWQKISSLGYRTNEPYPLPMEVAKTFNKIANYFTQNLGYSTDDLQKLFRINHSDLKFLYGASFGLENPRTLLRIV
jgi:Zn-dependent peptidase ImmA (M78 family)/transcriptional regulator with XRE-family HTH domain